MKKSLGPKTIVYPTPVFVVGTYDKDGKPNVMTASWGGISCSKPPAIAVAIRKATYTYDGLIGRKAFTINIPSEKYIKEADYFGIASGRDTDKFAVTGLTPVKSEIVDAPYIEEFPLSFECKLIHTVEVGLHTQFIGEVMDMKADESVLADDGNPDIEAVKPLIFTPVSRKYYGVGEFLGSAFSVGKELKQEE